MAIVEIVQAEYEHAEALVPLMRERDLADLETLACEDVLDVLTAGIDRSDYAFAAIHDGEVLCVGGVVSMGALMAREGLVWLVTQPAIDNHKRAFLRGSKQQLAIMLGMFDTLRQWERASETRGLRWMKWLGFREVREVTLSGIQMIEMEIP